MRAALVSACLALSLPSCKRDGVRALEGARSVQVVVRDSNEDTIFVTHPQTGAIARSGAGGISVRLGDGAWLPVTDEASPWLRFSPDGTRLAAGLPTRRRDGAGGPGIVRVAVWSVAESATLAWATQANWIEWAPDGANAAVAILFDRTEEAAIWIVDAPTGAKRKRLGPADDGPPTFYAPRFVFSPDGGSLAVVDDLGLRVVAVTGTGTVALLPPEETRQVTVVPFWSTDGTRVGASVRDGSEPGRLQVWDLSAPTSPNDFGEYSYHELEPAFSPDGKAVAVVTQRDGRRLLVLRRDGGEEVPVAELGANDHSKRVRWLSSTDMRVEGGQRVVDVTLK